LEAALIEQSGKTGWHPSIFSKLLAIMIGMNAVLLLIVTAFFALAVFPINLSTSERTAQQYARVLAMETPNLESARKIRQQYGFDIRYEGTDVSWTTSDSLPTLEQLRNGQAYPSFGFQYHVEAASGGGTYILGWDVRKQLQTAHFKLLWTLLLLIVAVVLAAYWFQKELLRPVQALSDGVARMSAGQLDIVLPVRTHDELGALTTAFNQMVRRVREMIQSRDQLLLDVSHELRSPLTRIKVALALLSEDENKASVVSDVKEMEVMIAELLELERLRSPYGICKEKQDLVPILNEVAQGFEDRSPGIQLVTNPPSIVANIDSDKIRVVLRNLLENAFKYSLPDSRPINLSAYEDQSDVVIRVQDDGRGLPELHVSNIFEPFFRIDPSRSKKTGGYGLGLSICKRITEAHGGTIKVETKPGRGALFVVTIPKTA
jgi:signal transduction histidine kinase